MRYFRDNTSNKVFAYDDEQIENGIVASQLVEMTQEEVAEHLAPRLPKVPFVVSAFQARAALSRAGLLGYVNTLMDDPSTPEEAVLAWEYATEFRRDSPTVEAFSSLLGLSEEEVDSLFRTASTITA